MTPIDHAAYLAHSRTAAYRRAVDHAAGILEKAAQVGPLVVMTSWGKDSVVLADLALRTLGRVPLLHIASSYRIPGWEGVYEHFAARTDVHTIEPRRTLSETIEWLREVGLPHERTPSQQQAVVQAIKKDVGTDWCRQHGFAVQALGMRAAENMRTRGRLFQRCGLVYMARGLMVAAPLGWWSARDVWAYLVAHGLPWHPMYDMETHGVTRETLRNSGWLSTDNAHTGRIAWLRHHYPDQFRMLVANFPQVTRWVS
jgi:phosphoadenosine phosphosulfate reductase